MADGGEAAVGLRDEFYVTVPRGRGGDVGGDEPAVSQNRRRKNEQSESQKRGFPAEIFSGPDEEEVSEKSGQKYRKNSRPKNYFVGVVPGFV